MINIYTNDLKQAEIDELAKINTVTNEVILSYASKCYTSAFNSLIAARLLAEKLKNDVYSIIKTDKKNYFKDYITLAISNEILDPRVAKFDLNKLNNALMFDNMRHFHYMGLTTLMDRYLIRNKDNDIIELPQTFFMRVAMGLHLNDIEKCKTDYDISIVSTNVIELYTVMSNMEYMPSTPTLFNSCTTHSQLSSCFVGTVSDSLTEIYKGISNVAQLSKHSGGLGMDWTNVRSSGSYIKGVSGRSQGIVPFLKVYNDTLVAVNQGGKRRGSGVAYIEPWHSDIMAFLALRKTTGEERLRCHDMNTALWVPDLFMKRVQEHKEWTLFDPADVPHLHSLFGAEFDLAYIATEADKSIQRSTINAASLWESILGTIYETGHPWITFKDEFNRRNPQAHDGVINSSNLCTEIGLNTSENEMAVCNLGSLNLTKFVHNSVINRSRLQFVVDIAIKALNKVIDHNYHVLDITKVSNKKHRAIGLGSMGFHTMLQQNGTEYESDKAVKLNMELAELIQFYAMQTSNSLARLYGPYESFEGSTWSEGILTHETASCRHTNNGRTNVISDYEYAELKRNIRNFGIRNCTLSAIAPTATISNIVGVSQSYEPIYSNLYSKSNLSGVFTQVNQELLEHYDNNDDFINTLIETEGQGTKYDPLDDMFKTSFDIDPHAIIRLAADRQVFIDQSISTNIYFNSVDGTALSNIYMDAWKSKMKSTYYLRTKAASEEKSEMCNLEEGCQSCQ